MSERTTDVTTRFDLVALVRAGNVLVRTQMEGSANLYALWDAFPDGEFVAFVGRAAARAFIAEDGASSGSIQRGSATLTAYTLKGR